MTMEDGRIMQVDSSILKAKFDEFYHTLIHTERVCHKNIPSSNLDTCQELRSEGSKLGTLASEQVSTQYKKDDLMTSSKMKTAGECGEGNPDLVPSSFRKTLRTSSLDGETSDLYDSLVMESQLESEKRRNSSPDSAVDLFIRRKEQPVVEIVKHCWKESLKESKSSDIQHEVTWNKLRSYSFEGSELFTNSSDLTIVSKEEYGKYRNRGVWCQNGSEALQESSYINCEKENLTTRRGKNSLGNSKSIFQNNGSTEVITAENLRSKLSMKPPKKKGDDLTKVSRTEVQRHRKHMCDLITVKHDAKRLSMELDKLGTEPKQSDICSIDTKSHEMSKRKVNTCKKFELVKKESIDTYTTPPCDDYPKVDDSNTESIDDYFTKAESNQLKKGVNTVSKRKRPAAPYDITEPARKCRKSSMSDDTNIVDKQVATSLSTKISKNDLYLANHNTKDKHEEPLDDRYKNTFRASLNKTSNNLKTSKHSNINKKQTKINSSIKLQRGSKGVAIKESTSVLNHFHRKMDSFIKTVQPITIDKVTDVKRLSLQTIDDIHKQIADTNMSSPDNLVQAGSAINIDTLELLIPLNKSNEIHKRKVKEKPTNKRLIGLKSYATAPIWQRVTSDYE